MPKQNTLPTPEEELPAAAIAFMKNGSKRTRPVDVSDEVVLDVPTPATSDEEAESVATTKRPRKGRRSRDAGSETARPEIEPPRRPFSTRIRTDVYVRLKEVSLTRELKRKPPYHMSEIVEQAIESWLSNAKS